MKVIKVFNFGNLAGYLYEIEKGKMYKFTYAEDYLGPAISQTMPVDKRDYQYEEFPPFFDGLLPEGSQLENLIRQTKTDRSDYLLHLITVGKDLVGSITVEAGE